MTGPLLIGVGRNADVFAIDERRVLRRYRDGGDVTAEAAVMTYVAERGYPVPRIYAAAGTDLVMERVDGPTMLRALVAGDIGVEPAAEILADLHGRLHRVPSRFGSGEGILHLDLHPDNVILASRGPMVIDWRNQAEGPSDLDVAVTAVILAQVAADESSGLAEPAEALLRSSYGKPAGILGGCWTGRSGCVAPTRLSRPTTSGCWRRRRA